MTPRIGLARALLIASAFLLCSAASPSRVHAGFVFTVQSVSATAGSMNDTLQISLMNTGLSAVTIGGFAFEISSGSGVTFTAVDISTTLRYIFAGDSGFGPDISNQPPNLPGNTLAALDFSASGLGFSLAAGSSVGLGDVHFNVSPTASGPVAISFLGYPDTNLSDAAGNNISLTGSTLTGGTITVTPSAVPEPSSLVLLATALIGTASVVRARRGRPAR
jgi:PEP-CTERM motif